MSPQAISKNCSEISFSAALLVVRDRLRCGFARFKLQVRPVNLLLPLTD
jgi:hypothetical protein